MYQTKLVEKIKTHILCSILYFSENCAVFEMWENMVEPGRPQMTIWRSRIALGYPRLETRTQNMQYLLLFHCNNGYTNEPLCYVIRTLHVLFDPCAMTV